MKIKTWAGLGALSVALIAAAVWWLQRDGDPAQNYRTAKLERGTLTAAVSSSGTVNPVSQVSVGSQVSGQIREMLADFNTEVKQGQLIARIDPQTFEYKVRQASADLDSARAAVLNAQANIGAVMATVSKARLDADNAQRELERKKDLLDKGFISQSDYENTRNTAGTLAESLKVTQAQADVARAQAVAAQAAVKQREAALAQARVDLERTEIRSPVNGVVIKRSVDVGQTVAASLQAPELFIIARNLQDMQVEASIDEADISRVRPEQKVSFTIDAFPGRSFEGRVRQIRKAAVSSQNVVTYTVVVGFSNPGSVLLPGMTANVRIVTDTRENVLKVPNAALRVRIAGVEPPAAPGVPAGPTASAPGVVARAEPGGWWPSALAQTSAASSPGSAPALGTGAGTGGPLGELRNRLVADLALSPEQVAKVDAVLAEARPRFAELRNLPEDERAKARERITADIRARVSELLTPDQKQRYQQIAAEISGRPSTRGRIFLLGDKNQPVAHAVRLGITDGVSTELLVPPQGAEAAVLKEGATVITGAATAGAAGGSNASRTAPAGPRPMF